MKKIIVLCFVIISFSGCKKATVALTMIGTWSVTNYYNGGNDATAFFHGLYVDYRIKFEGNGHCTETATVAGNYTVNEGPWQLINNGNDLELTNQSNSSKRYFHIIEIKATTAQVSENNGDIVYHLKKE